MKVRRWGARLLILVMLSGALFYSACVGRPQVYDSPLAPERPGVRADRAATWPLRVASYNTWILPWFSDDYDERTKRIPAALTALDPDLVILQEVWSGGMRDEISAAFGPGYVTARCDGGGLMVLSRYPIRSERFTPFGFDCDLSPSEWFAKKGVMEVVVETPAGPVRVVDAHLALRDGGGGGKERQLRMLLSLLAERTDLPLILGADLNLDARAFPESELDSDYLRLLEAGLTDLDPPVLVAGRYEHPPPTREGWPRPTGSPGWHPDHLMVRDGPAGSITVTSFGLALDTVAAALSDHNLLLGEIVIEAP